MFCDQTILKLKGGNGGNGRVSFRHEKYAPKGGPNGGDGGNGGSVFLKVNTSLNSLMHLHRRKQFQAENGEPGGESLCHGKNGKDLALEVPQGTIVRRVSSKEQIADLSQKDNLFCIASGGKGGFGNAHFVSSIRQAPTFAELGEEGEEIEVELELKLVADVGIIGIPNAGKSSLISVISNAKPKIAAYPFTTLVPHLGVVQIDEKATFVAADIPGLIEGAHHGKGLGIQFLKHVQRCRLLVHLIDPSQENVVENFNMLNKELALFSKNLAKKTQIIVINKSDLMDQTQVESLFKALKKTIGRKKGFLLYPKAISCATTHGVSELKKFLFQQLEKIPKPEWITDTEEKNHIFYRPHLENPKFFTIAKIAENLYRVSGKRIEQIANTTDFKNMEALERLHHVFKRMGIVKELKKSGAKDGAQISVGKKTLSYSDISNFSNP